MNFGGGYQSVDGGSKFGGGGYGSGGGYGGGGYSGGGGYVQGSQGFTSPGLGASPSAGGKGRVGRNQSVKVMSAAQLQTVEDVGDNLFKIDGKEIGMVSVVGEVMEVKETATSIVYMVDDRTGPWVKVQRWIEDQGTPADMHERSSCREGMYIRAIGHLKSFNNQKSITAFCVRPIEDFNEVTHHLSEVMFAHLTATKGAPVPQQFKEQAKQVASGWGAPMATSTQMTPSRGGGGMYSGAHHDSGLNPVQQQVLNAIAGCNMDHGIDIRDLIRTMGQHGHGDVNVRSAVDFLCNEGHIYSTIDDDHYKSTDA